MASVGLLDQEAWNTRSVGCLYVDCMVIKHECLFYVACVHRTRSRAGCWYIEEGRIPAMNGKHELYFTTVTAYSYSLQTWCPGQKLRDREGGSGTAG